MISGKRMSMEDIMNSMILSTNDRVLIDIESLENKYKSDSGVVFSGNGIIKKGDTIFFMEGTSVLVETSYGKKLMVEKLNIYATYGNR